ncbi:MAG TPA: tetratricopeptide repeat protein [Trebonia sp.]|nr:tetratricopeptide repeat protein [Trebonia sp.]
MFRGRSRQPASDTPALITAGLAQLQAGDRDGARKQFARAAKTSDALSLRSLGSAYLQAGDTVQAEQCFRRAMAAGVLDAQNDLGVLLKQTGRLGEAEFVLRQAADAGDPNAMNNVGNIFSERGDLQGAAWFWHQAALAGLPRAMCSLAAFLAGTEYQADARQWYELALAKVDEVPDIRQQLENLNAILNGSSPGRDHAGAHDPSGPGPAAATPPVPGAYDPGSAYQPTMVHRTLGSADNAGPPSPAEAPAVPIAPTTPAAQPQPGQPEESFEPTELTRVRRPRRDQPAAGPGAGQVSPAQATRMDTGLVQPVTPPPAKVSAEGQTKLVDKSSRGPSQPGASATPGGSRPADAPDPESTARLRGSGPQPAAAHTARLRPPQPPAAVEPAPAPVQPATSSGPSPAAAGQPRDTIYHLRITESLREQYLQTGTEATLQMAIESSQMALDAVRQGDAHGRALALGMRCVLLRMAYQRDKDQAKLADAIDAGRTALSLTRPSDPAYPRHVSNLAGALQEEYGRAKSPEVLDEALSTYRGAAGALPPGSPELAGMLSNIGNVLLTQGLKQQSQPLLTEAVEVAREAVGATDPDAAAFGTRLASLGMALVAHYANCGRPAGELDEAERVLSVAQATLPEAHPLRGQVQDYLDSASALRTAS